jgi:acetyl coenzyme A synthetase (ADP forming)-like protein
MLVDIPSEDVVASDGGSVHLRAARPGDLERVAAFYAGLSPESLYLRFFTGRRSLPPGFLERELSGDERERLVLLAELGDQIIAVASAVRPRDAAHAEVAFAVADTHQGRGLGTLLLERLAAACHARGVREFRADTLAHNARMLQVFADAGFQIERRPDPEVVALRFPIAPSPRLRAAIEAREHRADARSVAQLLRPRSIAVVGAGRARGNIGHEILRNLADGGFQGALYAVNPRATEVAGHKCYASVEAIGQPIDLAVLAVPAAQLEPTVAACARAGVRDLVIISSGLAEAGAAGQAHERELAAFARRHGMRVVGPNCIGVLNTDPAVRMNATFAPVTPPAGNVGFASQSGAVGIALLAHARRLGLGMSSFASLGNRADVSANDLLQYWEDDPATDVALLYLESFGNPRKFSRIARRMARVKPIVALKSGRSPAGERAAASHTAALAAPDLLVDALFAQSGVVRVDSVEELFDVAQLLADQPLPAGRRVAMVGNSGGPGIMAADACERWGLEVPLLGEPLQRALRAAAGAGAAAVHNPVDLGAAAGPLEFEAALRALLHSGEVDAVLAIYTPPLVTRPDEVAVAVARAADGRGDTALLACFLAVEAPPTALRRAQPRRIPWYPYPEPAIRALARAAAHAAWRRQPSAPPPELERFDVAAARARIGRALREHGEGWLDAVACFELMGLLGIPHVPVQRVDSAQQARSAAAALRLPVALKAASPALLHKTDVGAVVLGLDSPAAVAAAYRKMQAALGERMGGALLQSMAAPGIELICGVTQDPDFGPLVMFGMGGVTAELLADRVFHLAPLGEPEAARMLRALRGSPLLFGYRGAPPADVAALQDLLLRVGKLAAELPEVVELDLNPVIASPRGALAVDVRIRLAPCRPAPELTARWLG